MDAGTATSVRHLNTCCFCIPLRLGIFINACGTIVASSFMIFAKHEFEESMRIFGGGYVMISRVLIHALEITGCMWGVIGAMGAWQCKERFLEIYNTYQMARVLMWFCMYATDGPVLWHCELWMTDIKAAIEMQGYNPVMYKIALEGRCPQERAYFFFFSTVSLLFFIYLTRINQIYQEQLAEEPAYLLRIPKQNAGGAFCQESLGETRYLLRGSEQVVGDAVKAPRSGVEPGAYRSPQTYTGPSHYWGGSDGLPPVKKTPWEAQG